MTFFYKMNNTIRPFINIFRYSHHHSLSNFSNIITKNKVIINLIGEIESVYTASWEIRSFAQENALFTANIIHDNETLQHLFLRNDYLEFIVNRCYNISCEQLIQLDQTINQNLEWKPYNLYVMPNATNKFTTCNFIQNCNLMTNCIIYPLAASVEMKRRDINILIK